MFPALFFRFLIEAQTIIDHLTAFFILKVHLGSFAELASDLMDWLGCQLLDLAVGLGKFEDEVDSEKDDDDIHDAVYDFVIFETR